MPIPIFNSVASFFLKRRISQIELFKDYPIEVQQEVLRKLVVYSIDTEIGKKNDLNNKRKRPTMKLKCLKCKNGS